MTINGDIIEIDLNMDINDVLTLKDFVSKRLEYINEIVIVGEKNIFSSSSLFQLLFSIKKSKPSIIIDAIDNNLKLESFGTLHWIHNDK